MLHPRDSLNLVQRIGLTVTLGVFAFAAPTAQIAAQTPPVHYFQNMWMPPGAIGQQFLQRGGYNRGYFQPVEIRAPQGARIAMAMQGQFEPPQPAPALVGLLIGQVYRLQITNIPQYEGTEIFPTVEIINRLCPPPGQEMRFPIPIELTQEEIELAMRGGYVTRVIYLEDPNSALPYAQTPKQQRYIDVGRDQDPLFVADTLGAPMAILRMGSRIPDSAEDLSQFLYGSPPLMKFASPAAAESSPQRNVAAKPSTNVGR